MMKIYICKLYRFENKEKKSISNYANLGLKVMLNIGECINEISMFSLT